MAGSTLAVFPWPATTAWTPLSNGTATDCPSRNRLAHIVQISTFVAAGCIIVLLNVFQPRKCTCRDFLSRIIIPINLLSSTPFRVLYCFILSCWAADVLDDIMNSSLYSRSHNGIQDAFRFFVATPSLIFLRQALLYFPVLACVDAPVPLLAHCLGCLYTLLLAFNNIYREALVLKGCSHRGILSNKEIAIDVVMKTPVFVFYLVVALWYFCHVFMELTLLIFTRDRRKLMIDDYNHTEGFKRQVSCLLNGPPRAGGRKAGSALTNVWRMLRRYLVDGLKYVLPYHEGFGYPIQFMGAFSMAFMMLYQLTVYCTAHSIMATQNLLNYINTFNITVETIERLLPDSKGRLDTVFEDLQDFALAYKLILPLGLTIGFANCAVFALYMIQSVHKHMKRVARGNIYCLVRSQPLPSLSYRLAATMRFGGFQLAYILFAWMLYSLMLVGLMTIGLIFFYLFKDFNSSGIHVWSWIFVPLTWATLLHHLQLFLARYVFFDARTGSHYEGRFIRVRLHTLYNLVAYVLFFFNVIFGVASCFLRIFGVFMFTAVMQFRMDWDVYMRGLEGWDLGHRTYVGYVYLEYTYNNAVLRTFVELLRETCHHHQQQQQHHQLSGRVPARGADRKSVV